MDKCCQYKNEGIGFHFHPDITTKDTYLVLIGKRFFCGKFNLQWYGYNFDGWINSVGLQLDAPGTNASEWQQIWKIEKQ